MVLQQNPERKVEALILARFSEFIRLAHIPKGFRFSINKRSDKNNISLDVRHKNTRDKNISPGAVTVALDSNAVPVGMLRARATPSRSLSRLA
jgi:hypothetical protein